MIIKKVSNIYFGKQMIEPMNKFKITASCFGNHDFVHIKTFLLKNFKFY